MISAQVVKYLFGFKIFPSAGSYVVSFSPFFCMAFKELHPRLKGDFFFFFFLSVGETRNNRERFRTVQYLIQNANLCGL